MSTFAERRAERRALRRAARSELKNTAYEIFIGVLSILSIVNLVLVLALQDDPSLQLILQMMNALFSVIFLGDFIYRIVTAPSASHYFFRGFGWADLLASLPLPQFKILRLFRVLRVIRLMRQLGMRTIWFTLVRDRANSALLTLLLMGVLVLQWGSITMLAIEEDADGANITTASDALWYTVVTISTVGYGDQFPVTNLGRLLGVLIIIVGVGIFGTFTGYLANLFLGPRNTDASGEDGDDENADDEDAPVDPARPAVHGVAAGAASGAVAAGVDAAADSAGRADAAGAAGGVSDPGDDATDAPAGDASAAGHDAVGLEPATAERLDALLRESEETMAEIRALLSAAGRG